MGPVTDVISPFIQWYDWRSLLPVLKVTRTFCQSTRKEYLPDYGRPCSSAQTCTDNQNLHLQRKLIVYVHKRFAGKVRAWLCWVRVASHKVAGVQKPANCFSEGFLQPYSREWVIPEQPIVPGPKLSNNFYIGEDSLQAPCCGAHHPTRRFSKPRHILNLFEANHLTFFLVLSRTVIRPFLQQQYVFLLLVNKSYFYVLIGNEFSALQSYSEFFLRSPSHL